MIYVTLIVAIILVWFAYHHGVTKGFEQHASRWEGHMKRLTDKHAEMGERVGKMSIELWVQSDALNRALLEIGKLTEENRRLLQAVVKQTEAQK
ncbi:MAG: hypothetical protein ACYDBH_24720 [Acidobacteriaceae bacterium]